MDAVRFFKEKRRMCESFGKFCAGCEIYNESGLVGCRTLYKCFPNRRLISWRNGLKSTRRKLI